MVKQMQFINPHPLPVFYYTGSRTNQQKNKTNAAMMLGHSNPTVHIPPWPSIDDRTAESFSPRHLTDLDAAAGEYSPIYLQEAISALQQYFPGELNSDSDAPVDAYSCDQFRMFEFKVRRCARGRSHDWTECPYAHPGEKARRRDPRKYHYSGTACAEFRKGSCKKGESCEFAHGVFECWLHPARYRTQACKDGLGCRRRVCFFAHAPEELRVLPCQSPRSINSGDSFVESPLRQALEAKSLSLFGSPSEEAGSDSPPMSPMTQPLSRSLGSGSGSIHEMVSSLRNLQLGIVKSMPSSWNVQAGSGSPIYGSPRGPVIRPSFCSLPNTPTQALTRRAIGKQDFWDTVCEEEPAMERVESGRDLRVRMFEKLSKENPLERVDPSDSTGADPDLGWVSELLK